MPRHLILSFILFALFGLTGCAAPRAVGMHALIANTAPVPPGGQRVEITGRGVLIWYFHPSAYTRLNVPKQPAEMLAYYRQHLKAAGWVEEKPEETAPTTGACWYSFERRSKIAGLEYTHEKLVMTLDASDVPERPSNLMKADFELEGDYVWDKPCLLPSYLTVGLMGEGAQAFGLCLAPW